MKRKLHRMGPHQAFFDEWGLEGSSWLFLAPPGGTQPMQFHKKEIAISFSLPLAVFILVIRVPALSKQLHQ